MQYDKIIIGGGFIRAIFCFILWKQRTKCSGFGV